MCATAAVTPSLVIPTQLIRQEPECCQTGEAPPSGLSLSRSSAMRRTEHCPAMQRSGRDGSERHLPRKAPGHRDDQRQPSSSTLSTSVTLARPGHRSSPTPPALPTNPHRTRGPTSNHLSRLLSLEAFRRRPQYVPPRRDGPASETLHKSTHSGCPRLRQMHPQQQKSAPPCATDGFHCSHRGKWLKTDPLPSRWGKA